LLAAQTALSKDGAVDADDLQTLIDF